MSLSKMKEMASKLDELHKEMRKSGEQLLKELFVEFFEKHPEVQAISWTQYTPYFNDGDACTFSMGDLYFVFHGDEARKYNVDSKPYDDEAFEWYEDGLCTWYLTGNNRKASLKEKMLQEDLLEIEKTLNACEEMLEQALGDHIRVTVTAKGMEIEEYDHD